MTPTIRTATEDDVEEVLRLVGSVPTPLPDCPWPVERYVGLGRALVAVDDGLVVGACMTRLEGVEGAIERVLVAPDHQRAGTGTALVDRALASLREAGAFRVSCTAWSFGGVVPVAGALERNRMHRVGLPRGSAVRYVADAAVLGSYDGVPLTAPGAPATHHDALVTHQLLSCVLDDLAAARGGDR